MLGRTIEAIFRAERSRVLAATIRVAHGDFGLAEEAVQDAFAAALARWPTEGLPAEPRAWLAAVARNKTIDTIRRNVRLRELLDPADAEPTETLQLVAVPDDRLRLIFTCCHPALSEDAQIALTLRTLAGLSTEEIARAFLVPRETMAQRLVRAKAKISGAGIPYEVPEATELPLRAAAVMHVIYLVFNEGYAATEGDSWLRRDLCAEAIRLARIVIELLPTPEAQGLLALMLLHDSRRDARVDAVGDVVLLEDQDRARWDRAAIAEALALVPCALRGTGPGTAGPYAIQSAIAALHTADVTDWPQIVALFDELIARAPSAVVSLNRAVAVAMVEGPAAALPLVDALRPALESFHLFHATRADLLRKLGREKDATAAYQKAYDLARSEPERRFLRRRLT